MRILGIDYGDARTGLSVSDPTGLLAGSPSVIKEWNPERLAERLAAYIAEQKIERVVMGYPKNMDGSYGFRAEACREFGRKLEEISHKPVDFIDERLTTVMAHNILSANNIRGKKRKETVLGIIT